MTNTSLDLSSRHELRHLAALIGAFRAAAGEIPFFLAGATARDLLLLYAHGIDPGRETLDTDLALMVSDWETFSALRSRLIDSGRFSPLGAALHRLLFDDWLEVDLIPFGGVELEDRTIAWPPGGNPVMGVFGFRESLDATMRVGLPGGQEIRIVSLPALVILKLMAWTERRLSQPRKDAYDLAGILKNYLDAGNQDRLYAEAAHLLDTPDFDYELSGAWLLGYDMAQLLPEDARAPVAEILTRESNPSGLVRLVGDMPIEASRALALLQNLNKGFRHT